MLLYLLAIVVVVGNWYFSYKNIRNNWSNILFLLITLVIPVLFHLGGLKYAASIHSQGAAFTSAFLAILLLLNSIVIVIVTIVYAIKNKKDKRYS